MKFWTASTTLAIVASLSCVDVGESNASRAPASFGLARSSYSVSTVDPVRELETIEDCLDAILPVLRSFDVPRARMLKLHVASVVADLRDPARGLGHKDTMESFMGLMQSIDSSEAYFRYLSDIPDEGIRARIRQIQDVKTALAKAYGYDRSNYTLNLYRMLDQMKKLMDELTAQVVPESLQRKLDALIVPMGNAKAKASTGDRPKAFSAAEPIALQVQTLYEDFNKLSGSPVSFDTGLMIQILNENLLDYIQYEEDSAKGPKP